MNYIHYLFFALLSAVLLAACNARVDKASPQPLSGKSKFALIQAKILQPKCIQCHSGAPGQTNLSSYDSIVQQGLVVAKNPEASRLYISIHSGAMPRGAPRLSEEDILLVTNWIQEGAYQFDPQSGEPLPPPPNSPNATFTWLQKNVFKPKCVVCHNAQKPRAKVDLSSYLGLMNSPPNKEGEKPVNLEHPKESTLYIEVAEAKMPPTIKMLTEPEVTALKDWLDAGAPDSVVAPGPEPLSATYSSLHKNVFSRRCGSCHGIPFTVANVDFTSYDKLIHSTGKMMKPVIPGTAMYSGIYQEVVTGRMPPARKVVTPEDVEILLQWILSGAPNN